MTTSLKDITKKLRYGKRLRPGRDWLILLAAFVIALMLSVVYNLVMFSQVTKGQKVGNVATSTSAEIELDQVKNLFDTRAAERARYGSDFRFVDPSL